MKATHFHDVYGDGVSEVCLKQHGHDDLSVVNAARVSFNKESQWGEDEHGEESLKAGDVKLLNYLSRNGHWTPYSHAQVLVLKDMTISGMNSWMLSTQKNQFYRVWVRSYMDNGVPRIQFLERGSVYSWIAAGLIPPSINTRNLSNTLKAWRDVEGVFASVRDTNVVQDCSIYVSDEDAFYANVGDSLIGFAMDDMQEISNLLTVTFRITMPIAIARQWFRSVVGFARNEVSRRYVDDEPKFYNPSEWRSRPVGGMKQGSGKDSANAVQLNQFREPCQSIAEDVYVECAEYYENMVDPENGNCAPEQARFILPAGMYTSFWETASLADYHRLYRQRIDGHAQKEIADYANAIGMVLEDQYPRVWNALNRIHKID